MRGINAVFGVLLLFATFCMSEDVPEIDATVHINSLSEQVSAILDHFKSEDPVGVPGAPIPDPMPIPEMKTSLALGTLTLKDQSVYGLSKFRIESMYSNLADMEMTVGIKIDILQVLGNYSFRTWVSSAQGASKTTLTELFAYGLAKLEVARDGYLEAIDIDLDLSVTDIDVNLENPGYMGKILQGAMNSVGTLVFDTFKPYFMRMVNTQVLGDLNKNLRSMSRKHQDFPETFPNSLSPLDYGIAEGRKLVRLNGFDPYKVNDFKHSTGILNLDVTHIWVTGLATFHRIGNISILMENNTVHFEMAVGTQQLEGKCNWEVSMMGMMSTLGTLKFTVEYLEVVTKVNQSLDVRKRPNLEELKISLGNFQLQFDGAGTLDYVVEALVNILPNLLRYQIMLAIEEPLKIKVQEIFNEIDIEKQIKDQIHKMESSGGVNDIPPNSKPPPEEGLTIDESRLDDSIF